MNVEFSEISLGVQRSIAHRLAPPKNANRILVFNAGNIVQDGDFASLTKTKGQSRTQTHSTESVERRRAARLCERRDPGLKVTSPFAAIASGGEGYLPLK